MPQSWELSPQSLAPRHAVLRPRDAREEAPGTQAGLGETACLPQAAVPGGGHTGVSVGSRDPPGPLPFRRVGLTPHPSSQGPCPALSSQP